MARVTTLPPSARAGSKPAMAGGPPTRAMVGEKVGLERRGVRERKARGFENASGMNRSDMPGTPGSTSRLPDPALQERPRRARGLGMGLGNILRSALNLFT